MEEGKPLAETRAPRSVSCKGHIPKGLWAQAS